MGDATHLPPKVCAARKSLPCFHPEVTTNSDRHPELSPCSVRRSLLAPQLLRLALCTLVGARNARVRGSTRSTRSTTPVPAVSRETISAGDCFLAARIQPPKNPVRRTKVRSDNTSDLNDYTNSTYRSMRPVPARHGDPLVLIDPMASRAR